LLVRLITNLLSPASDMPCQSSLRSAIKCDVVVPRATRKTSEITFSWKAITSYLFFAMFSPLPFIPFSFSFLFLFSMFPFFSSLSAPLPASSPFHPARDLGVLSTSHRSPGRIAVSNPYSKCILRVFRAHGTRRVAADVLCFMLNKIWRLKLMCVFKIVSFPRFSVIICQHCTLGGGGV